MLDFDIEEEKNYTIALGKQKNPDEAIERLNKFFRDGWFKNSLLGNKPVVLKLKSFLGEGGEEFPVIISGTGAERVASIENK